VRSSLKLRPATLSPSFFDDSCLQVLESNRRRNCKSFFNELYSTLGAPVFLKPTLALSIVASARCRDHRQLNDRDYRLHSGPAHTVAAEINVTSFDAIVLPQHQQ
jgi:hypothetical protein